MAIDVEVGPFISMGNVSYPTDTKGVPVVIEEIDPEAGPNLSYQGEGILDPRYFVQKDYAAGRQGSILANLNSPYVLSVDQNPSALGVAKIAAAQAAVSGTAFTFAAASTGISTNVPFYPFKSQVVVNAPIALDFGFMGSTANAAVDTLSVAASATATASSLLAASNFYPGQWVVMPNGASATTTLITQVLSVTGTTIVFTNSIPVTTTTQMVGSASIPNGTWIEIGRAHV